MSGRGDGPRRSLRGLGEDVVVGPDCIIGPEVEIGRGTRLSSHVCVMGATKLGEFNTLGPFVSIGGEPQDVSYWGAPRGWRSATITRWTRA